MTKLKEAEKQKLQQGFQKKSPGQPLPRGQFEPEAKKAVEAQFKMGWMELWLDGWEGHHIQPVNWSGGDVTPNVQFLKCAEHYPFNTWWDAKKSEILKLL